LLIHSPLPQVIDSSHNLWFLTPSLLAPVAPRMPRDRQAYQGAESIAGMVLQVLGLQGELVEPLRQGLEGLLPLQPGQGGAQAVMDARPEGHMGVRIAGNVKLVRLREYPGVPIGGGD